MKTRVKSYVATIEPDDIDSMLSFRDSVKSINRHLRSLSDFSPQYRLIFRGRLGDNNPYAHLYKPTNRYKHQVIALGHAERVDVYIKPIR